MGRLDSREDLGVPDGWRVRGRELSRVEIRGLPAAIRARGVRSAVLWGEGDRMFPPSAARATARALGVAVRWVPKARHGPEVQTQADIQALGEYGIESIDAGGKGRDFGVVLIAHEEAFFTRDPYLRAQDELVDAEADLPRLLRMKRAPWRRHRQRAQTHYMSALHGLPDFLSR